MEQINNAKLYAPVATFTINDNIKFLEKIKINKNINYIIWLIQHIEILLDCLLFYSKMVMLILRETLLINTTCH